MVNWYKKTVKHSNKLIRWVYNNIDSVESLLNNKFQFSHNLPVGFRFSRENDGTWSLVGPNNYRIGVSEKSPELALSRASQLLNFIVTQYLKKTVACTLPRKQASSEDRCNYPIAGGTICGLTVGTYIKNTSSISASFNAGEYEVLRGIRQVNVSEFDASPRDMFFKS